MLCKLAAYTCKPCNSTLPGRKSSVICHSRTGACQPKPKCPSLAYLRKKFEWTTNTSEEDPTRYAFASLIVMSLEFDVG